MSDKEKKPDAAASVNVWDNGIYRFPLRKKIPAHGEEISTLEIREPVGDDVIAVGVIANIKEDGTLAFDMAKSAAMLSRLAGIPVSSIGRMAPNDLVTATWALAPFFLPN